MLKEQKRLVDIMAEVGFIYYHTIPSVLCDFRIVFYNIELITSGRLAIDITRNTFNNEHFYLTKFSTVDSKYAVNPLNKTEFNIFLGELINNINRKGIVDFIHYLHKHNGMCIS